MTFQVGIHKRKHRRTRGKRRHYMVLQCPVCKHRIISPTRVAHTYAAFKRWLRTTFGLKQHFSRDNAIKEMFRG